MCQRNKLRKNSLLTILLLLLISGCTKQQPRVKKPSCIIHPTSKDGNKTEIKESLPILSEDEGLTVVDEGNGSSEVVGEYCIVDVFTDSLFLNGDRIKLIQNLDALPWEKRALLKVYKEHTSLWNKRQKEDFKKILEEDKYLSLCGDRRYYDNLLFTVDEPQVDILYSILLLKYLNNLSNGCKKWVTKKVADENSYKNIHKSIHAEYLLEMIEKDAIVERLFIPFLPRQKRFLIAIKEYKRMKHHDEKLEKLKNKRLEIEELKVIKEYPNYRK
jgi:hypothetical protein